MITIYLVVGHEELLQLIAIADLLWNSPCREKTNPYKTEKLIPFFFVFIRRHKHRSKWVARHLSRDCSWDSVDSDCSSSLALGEWVLVIALTTAWMDRLGMPTPGVVFILSPYLRHRCELRSIEAGEITEDRTLFPNFHTRYLIITQINNL